jgi:hypothetical protein
MEGGLPQQIVAIAIRHLSTPIYELPHSGEDNRAAETETQDGTDQQQDK